MGLTVKCGGVLCDLDGVLADSHSAVERHWREFARRVGLDPDVIVERAAGAPSSEVIASLFSGTEATEHARWYEALECDDPMGVAPIGGADRFVAGARQDRFAIVTSCGRRLAHHRLGLVGIAPPPLMVTAEDVAAGKPAPDPYLAGAAALGIAPHDAIVIEDSLNGVIAGKAAGATVIAVLGSAGERVGSQVHVLADYAVPDVASLELGDGFIRIDGHLPA